MTKIYKKTNKNTPDSITSIDKKIAQDLRLDDRMEVSASRDVFITLKDHKPDFINNPNVIKWFQAIPNKSQHAFITFDVCDFYPSITEQLLTRALDYASRFTHITPQDHFITHTKKSLLYHQNTPG